MSDSSPPINRRKPLPKPPIVEESPSPIRQSRRQLLLTCPFLDHQAKEGDEDESVDGSVNSSDDGDESDLSYITHGSHPDASFSIYARAMDSQGGFPTPIHEEAYTARGLEPLANIIEERIFLRRLSRRTSAALNQDPGLQEIETIIQNQASPQPIKVNTIHHLHQAISPNIEVVTVKSTSPEKIYPLFRPGGHNQRTFVSNMLSPHGLVPPPMLEPHKRPPNRLRLRKGLGLRFRYVTTRPD